MAKGKKKSAASGGPHKKHGLKKKLHHCWSSTMRKHFADAGLLTKYHDYESWQTSCAARGKKNVSRSDFNDFVKLSKEEKDKYFENIRK